MSTKSSKHQKCLWLASWYIQLPVLLPVKDCCNIKMAANFLNYKILNTPSFDPRYEKIVPNYAKRVFSWWWRHRWRHRVASSRPSVFLYKWNKNIFQDNQKRSVISSLKFPYIGIMGWWLFSYKIVFMTSLMTSVGHEVGQILKLLYFQQYISYSVDQKLKISKILMAISLVYSTSGKKVCRDLKMAAISKIWNIKQSFNLTSAMRISSQIMQKNHFRGDDVIKIR